LTHCAKNKQKSMADDDLTNVEVMGTPTWTPEQVLLAAQKQVDLYDCIVVTGIVTGPDGHKRSSVITAGADNRDLYFLAEAIKARARNNGG
jgi:hypothetical protein